MMEGLVCTCMHTNTLTHTHMHTTNTCTHAYACTYMHACTAVYTHTHNSLITNVHIYTVIFSTGIWQSWFDWFWQNIFNIPEGWLTSRAYSISTYKHLNILSNIEWRGRSSCYCKGSRSYWWEEGHQSNFSVCIKILQIKWWLVTVVMCVLLCRIVPSC